MTVFWVLLVIGICGLLLVLLGGDDMGSGE